MMPLTPSSWRSKFSGSSPPWLQLLYSHRLVFRSACLSCNSPGLGMPNDVCPISGKIKELLDFSLTFQMFQVRS